MNLKRSAFRAAMLTTALAVVLGTGASAYADTAGSHGIASGNQVNIPVTAPIDVCGNSVALLGGALDYCPGGASASQPETDFSESQTSGREGVLSGNQVNVPITAPVNACGNGVAVLGGALGACQGGASATAPDGDMDGDMDEASTTDGRHGVLSGNQVDVPVTAPVNACGNAVGNALAACQGGATVTPDTDELPYSAPNTETRAADDPNPGVNVPGVGQVNLPVGGVNLPGVGDLGNLKPPTLPDLGF